MQQKTGSDLTNDIHNKPQIGQKSARKHAMRRESLIQSAIASFARSGYANTSLRAIAADAECSLGRIHYYFTDKDDLLANCVLQFKAQFCQTMENILSSSLEAPDISEALIDAFITSIERDGSQHRLWYDLRNQSMFTPKLRADVAVVEADLITIIAAYIERLGLHNLNPRLAYLMFDSVYRHWLHQAMTGNPDWHEGFRDDFQQTFIRLLSAG